MREVGLALTIDALTAEDSQALQEWTKGTSSCCNKRVRFTRPRVPHRQINDWHNGPRTGGNEPPKPWLRWSATLSRPWSTTPWSQSHGNGPALPPSKTRTNRQLRRKFRQAV